MLSFLNDGNPFHDQTIGFIVLGLLVLAVGAVILAAVSHRRAGGRLWPSFLFIGAIGAATFIGLATGLLGS